MCRLKESRQIIEQHSMLSMDDDLFAGKYRIPSFRLQGYDYRLPGRYFVTICTRDRVPWFGSIRNGYVCISDIGALIDSYWRTIPVAHNNVRIDDFIVMPDHMHGIIIIDDDHDRSIVETHQWCVSTDIASCVSLPVRRAGSLGSIIAQYKSLCTKRIHAMGYVDFAWQPRFHERIVRNSQEMDHIRGYIRSNPLQ